MSKKDTKKTVKPVPAKPASKLVEGTEGRVLINIYSPGHEPKEFRVSIPHINGAANLLHRSPEYVLEAIVNGLRAKYGERVS